MRQQPTTILGFDPGIATTGFALIETNQLKALDFGIISTPAQTDLALRLNELAADCEKLLQKSQPDLVAIESLFFFKNQKTAFTVAQARGVLLQTVAQQGVAIRELTPLQVKLAVTGNGRAEKSQIQKMVQQIFQLKEIPRPDDAADALAIAFTAS